MDNLSFESVIFDLDGIITKTALVHTRAWKSVFDEYLKIREGRDKEPFPEFTSQDYLTYVDGKPRYEGVKSFLESRNINLPFGSPSDSPDKETVCGVGNRKNQRFRQVLKEEGVEVYPSTIEFIKSLKSAGVKVGVASSSKNCRYVLKSAGIEGLFESRVDGEVSAELGLKGKPEGDIFVTAAARIGAVPSKSAVVEDAVSGVSAGRNGGFGLVIGVARKANEQDLLKNGADIAVKDLEDVNLEFIDKWFSKVPADLFDFWDKNPQISEMFNTEGGFSGNIVVNPCYTRKAKSVFMSSNKPVFFLDYDGTLTPIVDRPDLAVLSPEMKDILERLIKKYTVAVVSGRMREDVQNLVGINGIFYAGSHGFDILGKGCSMVHPEAEKLIPVVSEVIRILSEELKSIPGLLVEEKKFSTAVHYRLVSDEYLERIEATVKNTVNKYPSLRLMRGKKVFEILPAIDWDKGKAVRWILKALSLSRDETEVVYIGDDTTDEDAFRAVRTRGVGVLVSQERKASAADFRLLSVEQVKDFFERIL